MKTLLLLALCSTAQAADVPFYIREMGSERDVAAVNENFRALVSDLKELRDDLDTESGETDSVGDAVLSATQTFSGTNIFTSTLSSQGSIIHGSPTSGAGVNDALQLIWAKSVDGATQSSGCVVVFRMTDIGNSSSESAKLVFTSTTTSAANAALGVLHEQCIPGAFCRVAVGGLVRARAESGIVVGNCMRTTSATRCNMGDTADHAGTAGCKGYAMSTTNATSQWVWLLMGWK